MDITHVNEVFAELTKKAACMAQKIALKHKSSHPSNPEGEFQPPQRQVHIPEDLHGSDRLYALRFL